MKQHKHLLTILAFVIALPLAGHADEGFWPFNRIPRAGTASY
ncbi:MAG: hypothetical protein Q7R30_07695 [Acidobacteriota bacterium]|nr:hypothetical protein [Acidobacteriota bacterium]